MGRKVPKAWFPATISPMANDEFTAKRAQDSTSMVIMVLYSPLIPPGPPRVARTSLQCKTSRTMIMRVRRTLSETEIERDPREDQRLLVTHALVVQIVSIPIAMSPTLALSVTRVHQEEFGHPPKEARSMRQGNAMIRRFLE